MTNKEKKFPVIELVDSEPPTPRPSFAGDESATWVYWGKRDPEQIPDEWVWERLRNKRNDMLTDCDFRVVPDAPWDTAPWVEYRQALRDLPSTGIDPRTIVWPTPPQ